MRAKVHISLGKVRFLYAKIRLGPYFLFRWGGRSADGCLLFDEDTAAFLADAHQAALGMEVERRDIFCTLVDDHQHALFGEAPHLDFCFRCVEGMADDEAVVDVDGKAVSGQCRGELQGVLSFEGLWLSVFPLVAEAEVEEKAYDEEHAEGKQSVANHELFVAVNTFTHSVTGWMFRCKVNK